MTFARFVPPIFRSSAKRPDAAETLPKADGRFALAASILLAIFLFFGGTGAPHPLMLLPLEILGLIALGGILYYHIFGRPVRIGFWPAGLILGGGLILAWLQLLPLPWELWRSLPGRELAAAAITEAGLAGHWRPLSLAPAYTRSALFTLFPSIAVFLFVCGLTFERRLQLVRIALAVALASAALGLVQLLLPGTPALYLSPRAIFDLSSGIFANRNFQATFLLIALAICISVSKIAGISRGKSSFLGWTVGIAAFLAAMVLATQSRFGLLGLLATLAGSAYALGAIGRTRSHSNLQRTVKVGELAVPATAIAAGLVVVLALGVVVFPGVFDRFDIGPTEDTVGELRITAIPDLMVAAGSYFPLGTGLGTFDPVFRSVESLELVSPVYFNHAHDDYIELVIEMGAVGILLPLALLVAFAIATVRAWRSRKLGPRRILAIGASCGLAIILLHSIVDYPLRTITLQCMFALLAAVLFVPDPAVSGTRPLRPPQSFAARLIVGAGIGVAVLSGCIVIAQTQLARQAVQSRAGAIAYLADPGNPRGVALYADAMLVAGQLKRAEALAIESIAASPVEAVGLRVLGMARNAMDPGSGDPALLLAGQTGWRDSQTQSWLVERAILAGQWRVGAMRAEALARQGRDKTVTHGFLALLTTQDETRRYLLRSLAEQPSWRRQFLTSDDARTVEQRRGMAALLAGLARTATPPTLSEARPTIDGLFRESDPRAAQLYRETLSRRAGTRENLLWDGGFALPASEYEPGPLNTIFDWRTYDNGGSFGTVERPIGEEDQALALGGAFGKDGRLAEKALNLGAGAYRLSWSGRRDNDDDAQGLTLVIRCDGGPQLAIRPLRNGLDDQWRTFTLQFTVPAQDCANQFVGFAAQQVPVGARPIVYIDDVVLKASAP